MQKAENAKEKLARNSNLELLMITVIALKGTNQDV